ncbi:hypothetical protein HD806DRAFT_287966 [Xylariaceae sp. AK1471]|nr:hypothetical protein HD806DRAFT_287966 [Xylariaceae sp. AK1471]
MLYARGPLRTLQLAAVLAVASATSIRPNWIVERDDTCAANFTKCSQAGLPANFCCATGSSCMVLAGGTTVLCCPEGNDCATIKSISCNLSLQDPATNPKAEVKTTELDGKLPTCGNGCCPFGYHCDDADGSTNCVIDADQSKKPEETSSTPSPTSAVQPSSTGTTSTTSSKAADSTDTAVPSTEKPPSTAAQTLNTAAIVGGLVGGLLALGLIAGGIWLLRQKRKKAAAELKKQRDSSSSFGNIISAPIPHADYHTQRLDFLAKAQSSSVASTPTLAQGRFPPSSPYSANYAFRHDSQMSDAPRSYHASAEVGGLRSLTDRYSRAAPPTIPNPFASPRGERQNSAGSESINIFADPSDVGSPLPNYNRRDTTWTQLQHHADQRAPESPVRRR